MGARRFSRATRLARLENPAPNRSDSASRVTVSFFPTKTQNIVHFSLEFWFFNHYLVAEKQTERARSGHRLKSGVVPGFPGNSGRVTVFGGRSSWAWGLRVFKKGVCDGNESGNLKSVSKIPA
jgi:hypothetical protein